MHSLQEIESAILKLPQMDLTALREWFYKFDAKKWDEQFETDAASGKLDKLADQAIKDFKAGKCKELYGY